MASVLPIRPDLATKRDPAADGVKPLVVAAKALATMLDVSHRTVRVWDAAGRLPTPVRVGVKVVWRIDEVHDWLDADCPDRATWTAMRAKRK